MVLFDCVSAPAGFAVAESIFLPPILFVVPGGAELKHPPRQFPHPLGMMARASASATVRGTEAEAWSVGRPMDQNDELNPRTVDGQQLEADWKHALDTASDAVSTSNRAKTLGIPEAAHAGEHIRGERQWLRSVRPTMRKLFPRRST
jgi:hypothetical protein